MPMHMHMHVVMRGAELGRLSAVCLVAWVSALRWTVLTDGWIGHAVCTKYHAWSPRSPLSTPAGSLHKRGLDMRRRVSGSVRIGCLSMGVGWDGMQPSKPRYLTLWATLTTRLLGGGGGGAFGGRGDRLPTHARKRAPTH